MKEVILYRGPLERARLKLLINSVQYKNFNEIEFVWIYPNQLTPEIDIHFNNFISEFGFKKVLVFNDQGLLFFDIIKTIKKYYKNQKIKKAHFIGFSAWRYSNAIQCNFKAWYINGVPEEDILYKKRFVEKIKSFVQWKLNLFFEKPDLIVTVSKPMTALVKRFVYKQAKFVEIPITTDTKVFKNNRPLSDKKYLVYLGTGAPWQALDLLKDLWYNLYLIDSSLKFRVISRDGRTKVLGEKIPAESIEFVGSNDFSQVADWLGEAKMGFLIRRENIVNEVAFPTKFAEYTASGALVALSKLKWDLTSYLQESNAGILLPADIEAKDSARLIYNYLQGSNGDNYLGRLEEVSSKLSNEYWVPELSQYLTEKQSSN